MLNAFWPPLPRKTDLLTILWVLYSIDETICIRKILLQKQLEIVSDS